MKTPPIYELNNKHFNMNKLDHISDIKDNSIFVKHYPDNDLQYRFSYQMNGIVYDTDFNTDKNAVEQERKKLIKE